MNQPVQCLSCDWACSLQEDTHCVLTVAALMKPEGLRAGTCPPWVQTGFEYGGVTLHYGALDA